MEAICDQISRYALWFTVFLAVNAASAENRYSPSLSAENQRIETVSDIFITNHRFISLDDRYPPPSAQSLEALVRQNPSSLPALILRGNGRLLREQPVDAMNDFNKVLSANPGNVRALVGKSRAYCGLGKLNSAVSELSKALNIAGEAERLKVRWELAKLYMQMRAGPKAEAEYLALLKMQFPSPNFKARATLEMAGLMAKSLRGVEALRYSELAGKLNPMLNIYPTKGQAFFLLKNYKQSVLSYTKAIGIAKSRSEYVGSGGADIRDLLKQRATVYICLNDLDAAKKDLDDRKALDREMFESVPFRARKSEFREFAP